MATLVTRGVAPANKPLTPFILSSMTRNSASRSWKRAHPGAQLTPSHGTVISRLVL
ncbi:hypothetical protein BpHYR1_011395 [Brachionus plicatilis]|uniref:Uncharacterized protein n=1 Tax=Brachionus plicatilis TaxID=10195 RepID=A0A3M7Q3Z3_BRAPC|nr:hypothetical protein BpHYR1_011395 [Brachionus plicatilis]